MQITILNFEKLVLSLASFILLTEDIRKKNIFKKVLYINYLVYYQKDQKQLKILFNNKNKINITYFYFAMKFDFKI